MIPTASMRFRQVTAVLALVWAVFAVVVGLHARFAAASSPALPVAFSRAAGVAVVHEVAPTAQAAGVAVRDELLAVDGVPLRTWLRAGGLARLREKQVVHLQLQRPGAIQKYEVSVPVLSARDRPFWIERLISWGGALVGIAFLALGFGIWRFKRERRESWVLLLFCSSMSVLLSVASPGTPWAMLMMEVTLPFVGAATFHLFTTYPIEPGWMIRYPVWRQSAYVVAALIALMSVTDSWLMRSMEWLEPVSVSFSTGLTLMGICILLTERIRNPHHPATEHVNIILLSAGTSFLPVVGVLLWHMFGGAPFSWVASLFGLFLFPLAVGYGIVRRELIDVRLAARSSAAYGMATLAITGLFALIITMTTEIVRQLGGDEPSPIISIPFVFIAILAFNPVRARLQAFVDRFFDRDRIAYRHAVREISEAMVSMLSAREIVERILIALTDTMGVERALVFLADTGESEAFRVAAARGDWDDEAEDLILAQEHPVCRGLWMQRRGMTRDDFDDESDPEQRERSRDVYDTLDVELLVPVLFGIELLGIIAVGRKLNGDRLGRDERQLLRTLANQSAIAIENAHAFDEIAQLNRTLEMRVEEQTRELKETQAQLMQSDKMRSLGQLVAGVAHELNNPIGFVHANLALLGDYVSRLTQEDISPERRNRAREAISKLLARSREGTTRVKEIVQDLRDFSRTERADLQRANLNEEIERTLGLMEPRLKGGITIRRDYGELPEVQCYAGQLNQVFMNLLMNACDALNEDGSIVIRTRCEQDHVTLEFQDDGHGIAPKDLERIFEPFYTTKTVGRGTGLGLSISYGIVQNHGGEMTVESEVGKGTIFRIRLPLNPPPPEILLSKSQLQRDE